MSKSEPHLLQEDEWTLVRDFTEDTHGYTHPKYEAKFVTDIPKHGLEDELVIIKETTAIGDCERLYQFPKTVIEDITGRLP